VVLETGSEPDLHAPIRPAVFRIENSAVYLARSARDMVTAAQAVLDAHVVNAPDGLCTSCGVPGPCRGHLDALQTLARYGRLPRRRPGASVPRSISRGVQRTPTFSWFLRSGGSS
jgi:hypothetical protein